MSCGCCGSPPTATSTALPVRAFNPNATRFGISLHPANEPAASTPCASRAHPSAQTRSRSARSQACGSRGSCAVVRTASDLLASEPGGKFFRDRRNLGAGDGTEHALGVARAMCSIHHPQPLRGLSVLQRHGYVENRPAGHYSQRAASRAADVVEFIDREARLQALAGLGARPDRRILSGSRHASNERPLQLGSGNVITVLLANLLGSVDDHQERTVSGQVSFDRTHLLY